MFSGSNEESTKDKFFFPDENNPWIAPTPPLHKQSSLATAAIEGLISPAGTTDVVDKHWFLDHKLFQVVVYGTIMANSLQMGLATDYPEWVHVWTFCEHYFTAGFLLEMIIKLFFLRSSYFSEGWNRMDFFLVWMSILDNWIVTPLSGGDSSTFGQLSVLRIVRVLRVARMARLLKVFKELYIILKGMFESMRSIFWVCLLFILTLYVFSILCVDVMGRKESPYGGWNNEIDEVEASAGVDAFNSYLFFGTIPRSMYTLFNVILGEEAPTVMRPVAEKQWYMVLVFICFIVFMAFGVLNVLIGVVVESTSEAAKEMERFDIEKIQNEKLQTLLKIRDVIFALDGNNSNTICIDELTEGWHDPAFRELLLQIQLPTGFSPEEMLYLLDVEGDGKISLDTFIISFYRLIVSDPFQQTCCMHSSLNEVKRDCKELHRRLDAEVKNIKEEISSVSSSLERLDALLQNGPQSEEVVAA